MNNYKHGISFILFGLICLMTAWILSSSIGDSIKQSIPSSGGLFGPIKTHQNNEIVEITIAQQVSDRHWSTVIAEVMDEDHNYLFSFSEELWYETGRDAEGPWSEGRTNSNISVTFPESGNYFINFSSENSQNSRAGDIQVEVSKKLGSSLAFLWIGFISLIIGIVLLFYFSDGFKNLAQLLNNIER